MPFLTIISSEVGATERVIPLDPAVETTVGRAQENTVVLADSKISRSHLSLACRAGVENVTHRIIKKKTLLNGEKLGGPTPLKEGDRLKLGEFTLVFSVEQPGKQAAPSGEVRKKAAVKSEPDDIVMDPAFMSMAMLYTEEMMAMKKRIHEQVLFKLNLPEIATKQIEDEELKAKLEMALDQVLREVRHELPRDVVMDVLRQALLDELVGFGPITPMLRDPSVDEVMVNGPERIFIERKGRLLETGAKFFDNRHLITIIQRIVEPLGRHVDEASPMVDARLPDGSRVNAVIPPLALDGPSVTVRKFAKRKLTTDDLIAYGSMTADIALFLEEAVRARQNMLVSGGTGSGKTTLLNVLSQFIPRGERLVTIEDSAELKLDHRNKVRLEARPSNIE